jgi:hypothetical protein
MKAGFQWLHVKLDKRIHEALKRESEARGGSQERRIREEALAIYFGLKKSKDRGIAFPFIGSKTEGRDPANPTRSRAIFFYNSIAH